MQIKEKEKVHELIEALLDTLQEENLAAARAIEKDIEVLVENLYTLRTQVINIERILDSAQDK